MLQAGGLDGGGYLKEFGGGFFLTSYGDKILLKAEGKSLSSLSDVSIYNPATNDLLAWSGYSWVNIPQSAVRPDLSGYVTTSTFNNAIAGLQSQIAALENFFELDDYGNVTLKSTYQNLWVPGWMAGGGIGNESGGGVSFLWELSDVYHGNTGVLRADGTPVRPGDSLVYNDQHGWVAALVEGGGGGGTVTDVTLNGVSVLSGTVAILPTSLPASDVSSWAKQPNPPSYAFSDLTGHPTTLAGYGITDAATSTDLSSLETRVEDLEDMFEIVNGAVHVKNGRPFYSDSWVSGGGAGSGGGMYTPGDGIDITNNVISLLTASTSALGGVKVDGTTITINNNGVISAVGGGGGSAGVQQIKIGTTTVSPVNGLATITNPVTTLISGWFSENFNITSLLSTGTAIATVQMGNSQFNLYAPSGGGTVTSVAMTVPSGMSVSPAQITSSGTFAISWSSQTKNYVFAAPSSANGTPSFRSLVEADIPDLSIKYVTLSTDQSNITGEKTFQKPLHVIASSGLSYIDIGGARLEWDADAAALRVTKRTGSTTVGLYADGSVSGGGVAASASRNIVFTDGDQTIDGEKTFTGRIVFNGTNLGDSDYGIDALCDSRFTNIAATGNVSASTFGGFVKIEKDSQNYIHVSGPSNDRLYIQRTSQDLVLCPSTNHCVVGTYVSPGSYKLYVNGTAYATSWNTPSDGRLKENIGAISGHDAISSIMMLKPSTWTWKEDGKLGAGLIAQDVESVFPFMVSDGEYKSLNYQMLHAYELSAIQDHELRIRKLESYAAL